MDRSKYAICSTMDQIKKLNKDRGYYFFSDATMSFFNSKPMKANPYGGFIFVTGERPTIQHKLQYTIRAILSSGRIESLSEFEVYSHADAHREAKRLSLA